MKKMFRVSSIVIFLFCSVHSYLWAFGVYEPKYEFFGGILIIGFLLSGFLMTYSFEVMQ